MTPFAREVCNASSVDNDAQNSHVDFNAHVKTHRPSSDGEKRFQKSTASVYRCLSAASYIWQQRSCLHEFTGRLCAVQRAVCAFAYKRNMPGTERWLQKQKKHFHLDVCEPIKGGSGVQRKSFSPIHSWTACIIRRDLSINRPF